jgi:hypothetical protein
MNSLRHILPVLIAFTFGAAINEVSNLREQAVTTAEHNHLMQVLDQEVADLRVDAEINYWLGRQGSNIEEDEAGWDCRTMGNRICGATEQKYMATPVAGSAPNGHTH